MTSFLPESEWLAATGDKPFDRPATTGSIEPRSGVLAANGAGSIATIVEQSRSDATLYSRQEGLQVALTGEGTAFVVSGELVVQGAASDPQAPTEEGFSEVAAEAVPVPIDSAGGTSIDAPPFIEAEVGVTPTSDLPAGTVVNLGGTPAIVGDDGFYYDVPNP